MSLAEATTNRVQELRSNQKGWVGNTIHRLQGIPPLFRSGDQRDSLKSLTQLQQVNAAKIDELERLLKKE